MNAEPVSTPGPWWQGAVIYQIYVRSFADSNGDGVGDLEGIRSRLDHLTETLGVDAVWLTPFFPSPMRDFGYDVADYCDVDPLFGDLAAFDALLAECHQRGLRLMIDWVPNHTSDLHPWFIESRSSRHNPKRDWFFWRDRADDGSPPNNWLAMFGGPSWEWDEPTGQYYLHSFLPEQPDLNWRNPEVETAMFDTLRFWLDRGVDGIRIDVAHYLMKDPDLADNPPAESPSGYRPLGEPDSQAHINDRGHPDILPLFRRLRAVLDSYAEDRFAIAEIHESDWEVWASYYQAPSLDSVHMPFNFSLLFAPWDAEELRQTIEAAEAAVPAGAWPNHVLGNHDEVRVASRFGERRAGLAAVLLLTLRGTVTMYYGDEIGMPEVLIPPGEIRDPQGIRLGTPTRDGCRTPMQWDDRTHAGFSPERAPGTWLPLSTDWRERNVSRQLGEPGSLLQLYRRLLAVRRSPSLRWGGFSLLPAPPGCLVYRRSAPESAPVVVALNLGEEPAVVEVPSGRVLVATDRGREGIVVSGAVDLAGNEGVVIEQS
jgi:glycosidase